MRWSGKVWAIDYRDASIGEEEAGAPTARCCGEGKYFCQAGLGRVFQVLQLRRVDFRRVLFFSSFVSTAIKDAPTVFACFLRVLMLFYSRN